MRRQGPDVVDAERRDGEQRGTAHQVGHNPQAQAPRLGRSDDATPQVTAEGGARDRAVADETRSEPLEALALVCRDPGFEVVLTHRRKAAVLLRILARRSAASPASTLPRSASILASTNGGRQLVGSLRAAA